MGTAKLNLKSISFLQQDIMRYIHCWVMEKNTPVPQKDLLKDMVNDTRKKSTIIHSLNILLREGWIRRAITNSNITKYVECRTLPYESIYI